MMKRVTAEELSKLAQELFAPVVGGLRDSLSWLEAEMSVLRDDLQELRKFTDRLATKDSVASVSEELQDFRKATGLEISKREEAERQLRKQFHAERRLKDKRVAEFLRQDAERAEVLLREVAANAAKVDRVFAALAQMQEAQSTQHEFYARALERLSALEGNSGGK